MQQDELYILVERYLAGTASKEEEALLQTWYATGLDHTVIWTVENKWDSEVQVKARMESWLNSQTKPKKVAFLQKKWLSVAATLLLFLALSIYFSKIIDRTQSYTVVRNANGQVKHIALSDGTEVWLNAATTIKYPKNLSKSREIQLEGEAYFKVTKKTKQPFIVQAGQLKTTVLGTAFNVKSFDEEKNTVISVESGKLAIIRKNQQLTRLKANECITYDKIRHTATVAYLNASTISAWRNGKLNFVSEKLSNITAELSRWYDVRFVFENEAIKNCEYNATFDNSIRLKELLLLLGDINGITFRIKGSTVYLSGNGC